MKEKKNIKSGELYLGVWEKTLSSVSRKSRQYRYDLYVSGKGIKI